MQSLPAWGINLPFDVHGTGSEASFDDSPELVDDDEFIIRKELENDDASKSSYLHEYEANKDALSAADTRLDDPGLFRKFLCSLRRLAFVDIFLWTKWYWLFCLRLPFRAVFLLMSYLMIIKVPSLKR